MKTLRMYVEESLEHLSNIENDLLSIEESGEDINEELVNNVFRAAHSIKGAQDSWDLIKSRIFPIISKTYLALSGAGACSKP